MLQFLLTLTDESNHSKIEYIYDNYHEYMMKFAVSKFKREGRRNCLFDAEDTVQNTFMKITKYLYNIDFSWTERDIKNYVFTMLSNEISNFLNNNPENLEFNEEICNEIEYNFIEELEIKEKYSEVVKAIETLDERYSTTLYMVYCKEMTVNEIAEMMGISTKTVYTRLARGRKLLLDTIKGEKLNG